MIRETHCECCGQAIAVDFAADGSGVVPPHGAKRSDGLRSCPAIGLPTVFEPPADRKRRRALAFAAEARRKSEEWEQRVAARVAAEVAAEVAEARIVPGQDLLRPPIPAGLVAIAVVGALAGPIGDPRPATGRHRRWPRPR